MASSVSKKLQQRQRQHPRVNSTILCSTVVTVALLFSPSIKPSSYNYKVEAFTISPLFPPPFSPSSSAVSHRPSRASNNLRRFSSVDENQAIDEEIAAITETEVPTPTVVRAPLKFIGPYPCLALKFPNLATESQRSRNQTGIALDFVLDTAANINTVQGQVAQELNLAILEDSPALPGVSSSGPMAGGETYVLGDTELEQAVVVGNVIDDESGEQSVGGKTVGDEPFEFMQNLTAAALPVVNSGSAGLLGLAFFYCFEGGVEFRWGAPSTQPQDSEPRLIDGMLVEPTLGDETSPSITFYGQDNDELQRSLAELNRVSIDPIPLTQLPSVQIRINGVEMVALLDTGSPVTVLNDRAAAAASIQTTKEIMEAPADDKAKGGWNPFASVVDKFKEAQATAEAASRGDILMIGGIDGKPTTLYKSTGSGPNISLVGNSGEDLSLGSNSQVYVGDIPGLAALNGIGVDSPPAVVLGLDVLRQRPRMVFRPRENELFL